MLLFAAGGCTHGTDLRFAPDMDPGHLRAARVQPAHWNPHDGDRGRCVTHRLAVDHRCHLELSEAQRHTRHLVRFAFPLADPDVLVRITVDRTLRVVHYHDVRHRPPRRMAVDGAGWTLVHLSYRSRLAGADQWPPDVRVAHVEPTFRSARLS